MLEFIVGKILSSAIVGPAINGLLQGQKNKLDALGTHEARVERVAIQAQQNDIREAAINAEVVKAEQGHWVTRSIRPIMGLAAAILAWKILVWDLALGQWTNGSTDKLSSQAFWLETTIVIAYMGGRTAESIATKITNVFKRD